MNNIAAVRDSIQQTVKAVEGAEVRVFTLKIFDIQTSVPTKSTMLITNMKNFFDVGLSVDPLDLPSCPLDPPGGRSIGDPCLWRLGWDFFLSDFLRLIEEYIISLDPPPPTSVPDPQSFSLQSLSLWGLSLESFSLDSFCLQIFPSSIRQLQS